MGIHSFSYTNQILPHSVRQSPHCCQTLNFSSLLLSAVISVSDQWNPPPLHSPPLFITSSVLHWAHQKPAPPHIYPYFQQSFTSSPAPVYSLQRGDIPMLLHVWQINIIAFQASPESFPDWTGVDQAYSKFCSLLTMCETSYARCMS